MKRFPHRVFFALKPSALDRLADKGFLVRGELHFHMISAYGAVRTCQAL